ncbi:MAG: hypothetical protein EXR62_03660 [Chloroflexi bacterium]|nr:hypothetical protein [Chloroflexota bacterium]
MNSNHWHLLLDNYSIARATGFDRIVHHPRPLGVVLAPDKPWESAGVGMNYVGQRANGSFFGFYSAMWWDLDKGAAQPPSKVTGGHDRAHDIISSIAYATSEDGIHWHKPILGLLDGPAAIDRQKYAPFPTAAGLTRENNLGVPIVVVADLGQFGNVTDPQRRFALRLAPGAPGTPGAAGPVGVGSSWAHAPHGYFAAEIPDFLNDPNWREKLTYSGGNFDPRRHFLHFWDDMHGEWVAIEQGVIPHWLPTREVGRMASQDLVNWTSEAVLYPDAADPHLPWHYDESMSLTPFCAEGVIFGLLSWFHSDRSHPDGGPNLASTPEHPQIWPWVRKGSNEMRITISRDGGRTWDRTASREAWIPHGTEEDSYDRLVIGSLPPMRMGEEDWFYVTVIDGDHLGIRNNAAQTPYYHQRLPRHQVGLYVQKHNRYVSLSTRTQPEVLITNPVTVGGSVLQLNVDASRGVVRVGIAAAEPVMTYNGTTPSTAAHLYQGQMLPGFTFEDCQPVDVNSIEHTVRFTGVDGLAALQGRAVRLLIQVQHADVYGFRFT